MNTYIVIREILEQIYSGRNLNDTLSDYNEEKEISRIKNIVYGVLRYSFAIDFIINQLTRKVDYDYINFVRVGIFELWFSNKPDYAVINDLVEVMKEVSEKQSLANFMNATLRSFQNKKEELIDKIDKDYELKYNLPKWMLEKLKIQYKGNYKPILESFMYHPSFGLRINTRKISLDDYCEELTNNKLSYIKLDNKIILENPTSVSNLPLFENGFVSVQDIGAQFIVDILNKNEVKFKTVLDACSAPGGKACQILENFDCNLTALDIDKLRLEKVQQNLQRLNLSAKILLGDASTKKWLNNDKFDLIIADVPCSATGTIKRNPDIKINRRETDLEKFVAQQRSIVINLWDILETGGYMLYVTCSIFKEENQFNIEYLKNNLSGFNKIDELQVIPSEYNDGLYYALIRKDK